MTDLETLNDVRVALGEFYTEQDVDDWFVLPHPQLESLPAITVWCSGDRGKELVRDVIRRLQSDGYL